MSQSKEDSKNIDKNNIEIIKTSDIIENNIKYRNRKTQ